MVNTATPSTAAPKVEPPKTVTLEPLDSDIFPEVTPPLDWPGDLEWGKTRRIRAETFDLQADVKKAATSQTWKSLCGISIYCDAVTYSGPLPNGVLTITDIAFPWLSLKYLHIYARDFLTGVKDLKAVAVGSQYEVKISLVASQVPPGLPIIPKAVQNPPAEWPAYQKQNRCVRLAQKDKGVYRDVELISGEAGWKLSLKPPAVVDVQALQSVPPFELTEPTLAELYMYRKPADVLKMLPKLLQLQLLAVSSEIFEKSPTCKMQSKIISRLQFIVNCTRRSVDLSAFTSDIEVLLERIEAPYKYPCLLSEKQPTTPLYAPLRKPKQCLDSLLERLVAAEQLDKDISELSERISAAKLAQWNFGTLIEQLAENEARQISTQITEVSVNDAVMDLDKQRATMETYKEATKKAKLDFDAGLKSLAKDEEAAAVHEMWMVAGEFAVGIVVTFASGGAAAPAAAEAAAGAAKSIKKASKLKETLKKLWEILKKLGEVAGDVGPKLLAAYQNQSTFKFLGKPTEATQKNEKNKDASDDVMKLATSGPNGMPALESASTDFVGMEADWQEYQVKISLMFETIKDMFPGKTIDGMQTYRQALESQVIRGRAVLASMKTFQATVQTFLVQKANKAALAKRHDELQSTAGNVKELDDRRMRLRNETRRAFQQSLIAARRGIFIAIHEVALAHAYTTGISEFPPELLNSSQTDTSKHVARADSPSPRFRRTYVALQHVMDDRMKSEANRQMSSTKAIVNTSMETVFHIGWRELAVPYGRISLSVPPGETLKVDSQFYRMRMVGVWVHVIVAKKQVPGIDFRITVGPLMHTRNGTRQIANFYSSPRWLRGTSSSKDSVAWFKQTEFIEPALLSDIIIDLEPTDVVKAILPQSARPDIAIASKTTQEPKTTATTKKRRTCSSRWLPRLPKSMRSRLNSSSKASRFNRGVC